jgi:hypothetical protein
MRCGLCDAVATCPRDQDLAHAAPNESALVVSVRALAMVAVNYDQAQLGDFQACSNASTIERSHAPFFERNEYRQVWQSLNLIAW